MGSSGNGSDLVVTYFRSGRLSFHEVTRKIQIGDLTGVKFMVFDAPEISEPFSERIKRLEKLNLGENARFVTQTLCNGKDHLLRQLEGKVFIVYELKFQKQ